MKREKVINELLDNHQGDEIRYTTCFQNGCWDAVCPLKCRVRDNKLISVEPDDSVNKGLGREDIDAEKLSQGMVQLRPCPMGHAWQGELYAEDRILYPMKRVGEKGLGKGSFERISWDEALDTIAEKIRYVIDTYGPNSILHANQAFEQTGFELAPWLKAGVAGWGDHSTSGHTIGEKEHLGFDLVKALITGESKNYVGFEAPDLFNSNLIVLWGFDPLVGWFGTVSYYMRLAKERGIPIILIDPRYTISAEVLADQWLPIRPGTDVAMMLAVAQVLYEENLYDHDYVAKYVEPKGFERWRAYLMGENDGIVKSPEWAEPITAIPAETIREFARLYAKSKPVHLQYHYAGAKRHLGEYSATASMLLQAMTGNLTIPGGCQTGCTLTTPDRIPLPTLDLKRAPAEYYPPITMHNNKWAESILKRQEYDAGICTETEFRRAIGCPPESPLPNIQMVIFEDNWINNIHHVNKRMKAIASTYFSWGHAWHMSALTTHYMDIVLPAPVYMFETSDHFHMGMERFMSGPSGMRNYFMYCTKVVDPPGEVRPLFWIWTQLAKRLGVVDKYNPCLKDVSIEDWDDAVEALYKEAYENWAKDPYGYLAYYGIQPKPWEEFLKKPIVRVPIDQAYYPYKSTVDAGEDTFFETPSGKVEFCASTLEVIGKEETRYGGLIEIMPVWDPYYMDEPPNDSFYHPKTKNYPLSMVTPVSVYRQHSCNDPNLRLRECYRHGVWLNPVDAKTRNIKDGDKVFVHNEFGQVVMPAYVTNRLIPGTTCIHHGAYYTPGSEKTELMPTGVDMRGACNFLIGDTHLPHVTGTLLTAGLVQIKKYEGDRK